MRDPQPRTGFDRGRPDHLRDRRPSRLLCSSTSTSSKPQAQGKARLAVLKGTCGEWHSRPARRTLASRARAAAEGREEAAAMDRVKQHEMELHSALEANNNS